MEQPGVDDKPHLCRLERVGSVLFMYLIVNLNIFIGSLLWTDDNAKVNLSMDCCEMIEKNQP